MFLVVWRGQPETEAALVDLKGFAAPAVIVHLLTMLRPAAGVGSQSVSAVLLIFITHGMKPVRSKLIYSGPVM